MFQRSNDLEFQEEGSHMDGENNLRVPLLQSSESISVSLPQSSPKKDRKTRTLTFKIGGIKCASCAVSIESALRKLEGIESVTISPLQGQAVIIYRPESINVSI